MFEVDDSWLQWRHNRRDGISNHRLLDGLPNRLFRRRSKKTSKLCANGLCEGNSPVTGAFPSQRAGNAENVFIWLRHQFLRYWRVRHLRAMVTLYEALLHWHYADQMVVNSLGPRQMAAISQTTPSNTFSWMRMLEFRLKFHWSLFLMVQLTIFHHWFRWWLGAD